MEKTKQNVLKLIEDLLEQQVIKQQDIKRFVQKNDDLNDPEYIRFEMEEWYKNMGIESIIGRKLEISQCPFTEKEILEARRNNEIILCVPKDVSRIEFGRLFRIDSWSLHDPLVTHAPENEDCWFRTSISLTPAFLKETGIDISHRFEDEKKLNFSLERYLVFIGRMRYLTGKTPDSEYWIWLPRGRYDRSGMLIAGFDRHGTFNAHGWMPQFSASFLGARFGIPAESDLK